MNPSTCATDRSHPFAVLVVSREPRHAGAVRQAIKSWPMSTEVTVVPDVMAAVRSVLGRLPRLVVVDWDIDRLGGQALIHQLARLLPVLPVLAFDTTASVGPGGKPRAWPWSELPAVLDRWLMLTLDHEENAGQGS